MLQNTADFLPTVGWAMPLSVRELQMRILKSYALCPEAAESAERIAAQWLGGENVALVRATLEHLAGCGILARQMRGSARGDRRGKDGKGAESAEGGEENDVYILNRATANGAAAA